MTGGRTDGSDCNIPIAFLKKRWDNNQNKCFFNLEKKKNKNCAE